MRFGAQTKYRKWRSARAEGFSTLSSSDLAQPRFLSSRISQLTSEWLLQGRVVLHGGAWPLLYPLWKGRQAVYFRVSITTRKWDVIRRQSYPCPEKSSQGSTRLSSRRVNATSLLSKLIGFVWFLFIIEMDYK